MQSNVLKLHIYVCMNDQIVKWLNRYCYIKVIKTLQCSCFLFFFIFIKLNESSTCSYVFLNYYYEVFYKRVNYQVDVKTDTNSVKYTKTICYNIYKTKEKKQINVYQTEWLLVNISSIYYCLVCYIMKNNAHNVIYFIWMSS